MNENPHQSPIARDSTPIRVNDRFSEQAIARRMLEMRERGFSLGLYLRWSAKQYLLLVTYFGLVIVGLAYLELWMPLYLMIGMLVGRLARDVGWVRSSIKTWPFSVKVTDWDKVQQLADE